MTSLHTLNTLQEEERHIPKRSVSLLLHMVLMGKSEPSRLWKLEVSNQKKFPSPGTHHTSATSVKVAIINLQERVLVMPSFI